MYSATSRSAKRRRRQGGFQLVEAVVTTSLMSIGLLGLSASSILLTRIDKVADSTGAATSLAAKQLELVRSMPMDAPSHRPGSYSGGTQYPNGNSGTAISVGWGVSARDTPVAGLKTVAAVASWTELGQSHTATVAGYLRCSTVPCRVY